MTNSDTSKDFILVNSVISHYRAIYQWSMILVKSSLAARKGWKSISFKFVQVHSPSRLYQWSFLSEKNITNLRKIMMMMVVINANHGGEMCSRPALAQHCDAVLLYWGTTWGANVCDGQIYLNLLKQTGQCTMCCLCSMFSFQLNKLRHILMSWYIIQHVYLS